MFLICSSVSTHFCGLYWKIKLIVLSAALLCCFLWCNVLNGTIINTDPWEKRCQNTGSVFVKTGRPHHLFTQLCLPHLSQCKIKNLFVSFLSARTNLSFLPTVFSLLGHNMMLINETVLRRVVRESSFDIVLQLSAGLRQTMPHSMGAGKRLTDHCV